ncbi:Aste57867_23168 [Aphanomyces stellatus]|uniref:1-phosphatidylinositol 4-kinase n=1 Tax=Aphanomyces stellatus TaxID=120398 RepID=A0A485LM59_9STRA|nr:hypothetical protein As57867_023097 [Aphanomyces stellatus]VFT99816.1 Aste57867_23168 [Aphanomyces stellatus]
MKGPRASCEGFLTFRTSPYSPPPMVRNYCVLIGTCFYYYSTQEDADHMMRPKGEVDVIGVQDWDGKGNMHIYANGFLFATAQNKIFYAYADTAMDKEKWHRAIQMNIETNVPVLSLHGSPSSVTETALLSPVSSVQDLDTQAKCLQCPPDDVAAAALVKFKCSSCDNTFCDRHSQHKLPLPHRSYYSAMRICDDCNYTQSFVNYLKLIKQRLDCGICLYPRPLNPEAPIELIMPMGPSHTAATTIAIDLFKEGAITAEELEELLLADKRYLDHTLELPEIPLDIKILGLHREFRSKTFTVYRAIILLHQNLDSDPLVFKPIVEKLLQFSFVKINQVEFYWPQIVHAYLNVPTFEFEKVFWMDDLILSICSRSIHLALLLIWQLRGALEDAQDPLSPIKTQSNYARVVRLIVEIEVRVIGSSRADVLTSKRMLLPAMTDEQYSLVVKLMDVINDYRHQAESSATAPTPLDEGKFSDYSNFQQHLLAPKMDAAPSIHPTPPPVPDIKSVSDWIKRSDSAPPIKSITSPTMAAPTLGARRKSMSDADICVLANYYNDECEFVQQITDIAEKLRFVPITERKPMLAKHLETFRLPRMAYIPLVKATDPFEQVLRLPHNEGTAFSTKARVPILLVFEVIRGISTSLNLMSPGSAKGGVATPNIGGSVPTTPRYDVDEEVRHLINRGSLDKSLSPVAPTTAEDVGTTEAPTTPSIVEREIGSDEEDGIDTHDGCEVEGQGFNQPIDLSQMSISEEVLEREKARRKDLEAAFGESWSSKRERMKSLSPNGHLPGWDIVSMIGKSNDDMRQEVFTLQLIQKFMDIFKAASLPIWLKVYRIIATSSSTGIIETLVNAISLDGLKKRDGYVSLLHHFEKSYGPKDSARFLEAQTQYIQSMAGYSLVSYFLQIKDRHNGNIMLDNEGHIIHIDYGFLLGIAPGGSFSIETAPFKLTTEMVDCMGGPESEGFKEYVTLCTRGFLALQQNCDELCDLVEIMAVNSPYPCFFQKDTAYILSRFRARFKTTLSKHEVVSHMLYLIRKSHGNYSTNQYDNFQRMTNGIRP